MNLLSLLLPPPPVEKRMQSSVNISRAGLDFGIHTCTQVQPGVFLPCHTDVRFLLPNQALVIAGT